MGRQTRKYVPRVRTKRPLGLQNDGDQSPSRPHPFPEERPDGWYLPNPLGARLYQKSGLGKLTDDGIVLAPIEVLFCHWNRHVPITSEWVDQIVSRDKDFIAKAVVFDVSRSGGEIVIPISKNIAAKYSDQTFALKWPRNESHSKSQPVSEIRWFWASDNIDWYELKLWTDTVIMNSRIPEIFVIDDELDVTMYRLGYENLTGNQEVWSSLTKPELDIVGNFVERRRATESGCYISNVDNWPLPSIGVEHLSGINLRHEELDWLLCKFNQQDTGDSLFSFLVDSGCILRPGFKYGCKWRVYDDYVTNSHAPWLLQPLIDAPSSWEQMCLAVRLAEGVHKKWICGFGEDNNWVFLNIKRWRSGRA